MANKANAPNWKKIKAEYIKGGISQQKLADKYGISYSTLKRRAQQENWSSSRSEREQLAGKKLAEKLANQQAELMAQMAAIHDRAGLIAFKKLLKQFEDFPDSAATTKIIRQSAKVQEFDVGEGKPPWKMPLRTDIESDFSETVKNFTAMSKSFGLDAESKLKYSMFVNDAGGEEVSDDGFMDALAANCAEAWSIADQPANIHDGEDD